MTKLQIQNWREINKGSVKASFVVVIPQWHMEIREMTYFEKDGRHWVSLPGRKYEKDGETKYYYYVQFEKEVKERFNEACLQAIKDQILKEHSQQSLIEEEILF